MPETFAGASLLDRGNVVPALLAAVIAALVTSVLVPVVTKLAVAIQAIDLPGGRKNHPRPMPRLGGVAIGLGLLSGTGWVVVLMWPRSGLIVSLDVLVALIAGTSMVAMVGLVDDIIGVSALKKLAIQVVAAGLVVLVGWQFHVIGLPGGGTIALGPLSGVVTVVWIVGVTNAINLIDGLDGLATGVVAIIAGSFLAFSFAYDNVFAIVLTAAVLGACGGFLPYNREPARIFMGDAGSLTLGFLLGSLSVFSTLKSPAAVAILVPILALGVPVMDTGLVMGVRFLERPHGRFWRRFLRVLHADRNHIHHLLEEIVTTRRRAVRWVYAMVVASCAMALIVALTKDSNLGFVLVAVELAAVILVRQLGFSRQARTLARRRLEQTERLERTEREESAMIDEVAAQRAKAQG